MAKIRGIKPEFWTDEDIVELSISARLLFIGLWNLACDNGHLPDKPRQIKMRVLPADEVDVDVLLDELVNLGRIDRTAGTITIHRFAEHQKPHTRWWLTCDQPWCNVPDGATSTPRNGGATVAPPVRNGVATADVDGDVDGDVDKNLGRSDDQPSTTKVDDRFEEFWAAYPSRGKHSNPKKPARDKYLRIIKKTDPQVLIDAAKVYARAQRDQDPRHNAQAQTWLNQERWADQSSNVHQLHPDRDDDLEAQVDRHMRYHLGNPPDDVIENGTEKQWRNAQRDQFRERLLQERTS